MGFYFLRRIPWQSPVNSTPQQNRLSNLGHSRRNAGVTRSQHCVLFRAVTKRDAKNMQTGSVALELRADKEAGASAKVERSSHGRLIRKLRGALGEPICQALEDTSVVEIMLNPDGRLFVERLGQGMEVLANLEAGAAEIIIGTVAHALQTIRRGTAHDIAARIRYAKQSLAEATAAAIADLTADKCGAGLIAVDGAGNISMPHNTEGMYRGAVTADGVASVGIYTDDFTTVADFAL